jgi:hypothetical protein
MASISCDPNGRKRVLFSIGNVRRSVRFGKAPMKQAESFKVKVEQLVSSLVLNQPPDDETARWVAAVDDKTHAKLAAVGLLKPRSGEQAALGAFIDRFIENCTSAKQNTLENMKQVRRFGGLLRRRSGHPHDHPR